MTWAEAPDRPQAIGNITLIDGSRHLLERLVEGEVLEVLEIELDARA